MSINDLSDFPEIDRVYNKPHYKESEVRSIATERGYPVEGRMRPSTGARLLEVIACFHEQNEDGVCQETWREDEHETAAVFESRDGGELFTRVS